MKLRNLLVNLEYTVQGNPDTEISDIIYDSRKVEKGTAFVCLKGYTSDGHRYAKSAVEKGASALIISDSLDFEVPSDVAVVKVEDTRYALSLMSIEFFGHPEDELYTVAITGTKGKTTTTAMVAEIFEHAGRRLSWGPSATSAGRLSSHRSSGSGSRGPWPWRAG